MRREPVVLLVVMVGLAWLAALPNRVEGGKFRPDRPLFNPLSVDVDDGYAYFTNPDASSLSVFSLANPTNPTEVGYVKLPSLPYGLTVSNHYAYVPFEDGVMIVNATNPAEPTITNTYLDPGANVISVVGNYAYLASGVDLVILDVSNPAVPVQVGSYEAPGPIQQVAIEGNFAYVGYGVGNHIIDCYMSIVNIANPALPIDVATIPVPANFYIEDIAVSNHYAYMTFGQMWIWDVHNPAWPFLVEKYYQPGHISRVQVVNRLAYVGSVAEGVGVVDVSNPASPTLLNFFEASVGDFDIYDSFIYAVTEEEEGFSIFQFPVSVSATVPLPGGQLLSTIDDTTYEFLAGTFTDTVTVTHSFNVDSVPPINELIDIRHAFEVTAVYSDTGEPAQPAPGQTYTITVQYTDAEKGLAVEESLAFYYWDGEQWQREESSVVDAATNTVVATPDHFSLWAVLG